MKVLLRRARLLAEWWLVLAAALALAALAVHGRWTARLDFAAYDLALRQSAASRPSSTVSTTLIAAIDDASLSEIGAWPWPRETQARLVAAIAAGRPRAIGLDILLSEPRGDVGDAALAAALDGASAQGTRVVLPVAFRVPGSGGSAFTLDAPLKRFSGAGETGHVNLSPDPDGVIRRFQRVYRSGTAAWHPLPEVMIRAMPAPLGIPAGALVAADPLLIGYAGPPGTVPTVSAAALLRGEVPPGLLEGRDVLVGVTASGLGDYHAVPTGGGSLMAGVEIQANVLATLRGARPVRPAPAWLVYLFTLVPLALLFGAMRRLPPRLTGPVAAALALAAVLASWALFRFAGIWLSPVTALAALALAWPLWAWRRLAVAGRFIARELERTAGEDDAPPPADATGLSFLDRQLALLDAAAARERRLRAEHDEVIRLLSHDMRSPQSAILSLLAAQDDAPIAPEDAARIAGHARRTLALSDGFVHLSRAQLLAYEPQLLDLGELARDAAEALWAHSRERGMPLTVDAPGDGAEALVMGEAAMLQRMIVNLAENALKYGSAGSAVRLVVTAANGQARLEVCNTGPDIPAERQRELFERFSRAGLETARTPGVGLGLAFVHVAAQRHGGAVSCRSAGGETCFSVVLPLAR